MNKLKVGDEVQVRVGKDKGKRGKVLKIFTTESGQKKVVVEGVKLVKKSVKANPQNNEPGGFVFKEAAMDISNVSLFDAATGKLSKVGIRLNAEGKKERFLKINNQVVERN